MTIDNEGNLTYGPLTNNTFGNYTYDARNELTSASGLSYGYDPAGNRTSLTNGTNVAVYVIDPRSSQLLMRIKAGITNYYVYGTGLLYESDETATTVKTAFYHYDVRVSTVTLTDGNGNPTDMIEYSPYGTITYRTNAPGITPSDTFFLYNGQFGVQTDPNGLLYMRARYYNPYISRFLNPDPSGFAAGLNFYLFCDGNPISETDPFGLYGFSTMYWANLSVTGPWWQRAISIPLGVLSATVPDAVGISVNGSGGFIGGGTVGVQAVGFIQQWTGASYSFAGGTTGPQDNASVGFVSPQISVGISVSFAWSGEYNPSPNSWTGKFSEVGDNGIIANGGGFWSDTWQGMSFGPSLNVVPASMSYIDNVDYQLLSPSSSSQQSTYNPSASYTGEQQPAQSLSNPSSSPTGK